MYCDGDRIMKICKEKEISKLRAATIGCGRMGAFNSLNVVNNAPKFWMPISHLEALKIIENIEIVACSDINKSSALEAQKYFEIPNIYKEPKKMMEKESLDLIDL